MLDLFIYAGDVFSDEPQTYHDDAAYSQRHKDYRRKTLYGQSAYLHPQGLDTQQQTHQEGGKSEPCDKSQWYNRKGYQ